MRINVELGPEETEALERLALHSRCVKADDLEKSPYVYYSEAIGTTVIGATRREADRNFVIEAILGSIKWEI